MIIETANQIINEINPILERIYGEKLWSTEIVVSNRMSNTWGYASIVDDGLGEIKISAKVFAGKENSKAFRELVIHEMAHIFEYQIRRKMSHSKFWKEIVSNAGGVPSRFTTKEQRDEIGVVLKKKTYAYVCGCKIHMVSKLLNHRIKRGVNYRCKSCQTILVKE